MALVRVAKVASARESMTMIWKRAAALTAALVAALGSSLLPAHADPAGVFRTLNWEVAADRTMPTAAPPNFLKQWVADHGAATVTSPVRDGSYAARFQLNRGDPIQSGSKRAEISQRDEQPLNAERWYGFSVNLPTSWVPDVSAEIVSQWHQCDDCGGGSPPLALLTDEGRWKIDFRGATIDLGPYATGTWTDWVFHVKWRTDSQGMFEVWRNGQPVLQRTGATHAGGPRSPYFKFGIYKWDWNDPKKPSDTNERVMFYDSLRLGDQRATYDDVKPGGGSSCTATVPVASASATTYEAINPPAQAIDGNLSTRWSGQGFGASLILDLGSVRPVCGTRVAWHLGDQRWNDYTTYTSTDGAAYTKAWEGRSSGTTTGLEQALFTNGPRDARYVKISFWQNPQNDWASITEAAVLGS
ncbi:heparin lyase I family protein [Microtetraspora sp. AC03309]|uniref:heparin lyase I family protein n=1 Tax=Microtetraspora sp. AC03309 TaxID=2779376 RepID=UPI001E4235DA|nr:heparin lyase I family protein [Microtetraspora sp. AC03309]MCC5576279.1 heparin lyase I family protein [Microtetraspora sp. AC03309]